MSASREAIDAKRRARNEQSKAWATRRRVAWTTEEDAVIINEWLTEPSSEERDELGISRKLSRTVFACQGRAEELRRLLGLTGHSHCGVKPVVAMPVCQRCYMELPRTGVCDTCD